MLLQATERGDESLETGRYIVTYKENAGDEAARALSALGMRVADARDFHDQAVEARVGRRRRSWSCSPRSAPR